MALALSKLNSAVKSSATKTLSKNSSGSGTSSGSKSSSGRSSSTNNASGSSGNSYTGKTVQVAPGGNAPDGTKVGDTVVTAGGNYKVVEANTPGANYNPSSGLWSVKVSEPTSGSSGSSSKSSGSYTPVGSYLDQGLSASDKAAVESLQQLYETYKAQGNTEGMKQVHAAAEDIRSGYGYSGGGDGSLYLPIEMPQDTVPKVGLPSYTPQINQTNAVYDAAKAASLAALETAYNQSRLEAEAALGKIPGTYQAKANNIAANAAKEKLSFNEQAAYSGLNAGNGSQAALAMSNQLQNDLTSVRVAEANAEAEIQRQLTSLYIKYQDSIAEAVANNEYERAAALLAEYKAAAQSVVDTAQNQAALNLDVADFNRTTNQTNEQNNYNKQLELAQALAQLGDYSGYIPLGMSEAKAAELHRTWLAANPKTAAYLQLMG